MQETMLSMLSRRAIIRGLEACVIGKVAQDDRVLHSIASDYLRSQLSDIRKFFDKDQRAHSIVSLTEAITDHAAKNHHEKLFVIWRSTYYDAANKYFLHLEQGYTPPVGFSRAALDSFLDELNEFLNEVVSGLHTSGYAVTYLVRDSHYLVELQRDAETFYDTL